MHGIIIPNGLCFERHHSGIAIIDPNDFQLMLHGMVDKPLIFSMEDLKRFPSVDKFHFLECSGNGATEWKGATFNSVQFTHGLIHCVQYTGVSLRTLLRECGVKPKGKWLLVEGGDASGMNRSLPLEKALDDCMVAYAMNGEMLRPEQGYPLRLVVPGWEGSMWIKWLRRIEVGDMPWHTREETSKYTDLMPSGQSRQFSWVMEPKSVITSPSPEKPVLQKGQQNITGIAWSGQGKIKRVDVSTDGGKNWRPAKLQGPIISKCLTRFNFNWDWNGQPALLESRAIDQTGYVQPTLNVLRKERGTNSYYHNNAIQTWHVNASGKVDNVQT
ncbi:MAG: sulfite dehydrogenase [Emcibacter sp.]|nr:sulfite dehydrogenase [Emcibacter sp.]